MKKLIAMGLVLACFVCANVSLAAEPAIFTLAKWRGEYKGFGPSEALSSSRLGENVVTVKLTGIEFKHAKSDGKTVTDFYSYAKLNQLSPLDRIHLNPQTTALRVGDFAKDRSEFWFLFGPDSKDANVISIVMKVEGFGFGEISRNFSRDEVSHGVMTKVLKELNATVIDKLTTQ